MAIATTFKKSQTNDLDLSSGNLIVNSDLATNVVQKVQDVLNQFRGEWFLDTSIGVPYFQTILGQRNPDIGAIRALLLGYILKVNGVKEVLDTSAIAFDPASRALSWAFQIRLTDGVQIAVSNP